MKHKSTKRFTAFLLSGAMLATGFLSAVPVLHANAATELTTVSNGLKYRYIVKDANSCILKRVSDANNDWSLTTKSSLTIPDKIPGTNYVIKELGDQNQAIIHSNNANQTRISTLYLPKQVEVINPQALYDSEMPQLTNLYVNLNKLKRCTESAFGSSNNITNVYAYNSANSTYTNTNTITNFEKCYGLIYQYDPNGNLIYNTDGTPKYTEYTAMQGDLFRVKDSNLNGKLSFLSAVNYSKYCKELSYKYAQRIAQQNGFTATNITKQEKLEMIYNYIKSHVRYSAIYDTNGNRMEGLSHSSIGSLAMNSGVCDSLAFAFETLCRASGFTVTTSPTTSEVACVHVPGHMMNVVHLSASEGYYIVDCTTSSFMRTNGYENTSFEYMICYGLNYKKSQAMSNSVTFTTGMLSSNEFKSGHSFFKIMNQYVNGPKVEVYDKNKTSCKYINYTSSQTPAVGTTCNVSTFAYHNEIPQFISSYCYFGIKIGGVVIDTNKTTQTITVGGKKYLVRFETLNFGNGQPQVCSCSNYYSLSITRTT